MNDILLRSLTGFFFILLIIIGLAINDISAFVVMALFVLLGLFEYFSLLNVRKQGVNPFFGVVLGFLIFCCLRFSFDQPLFALSIIAFPPLVAITEIFRNKKKPLINVASVMFSWFYIVLPLFLLVYMGHGEIRHPALSIGLLFMIWSNDTFAYLAGRFFGKHLLMERVSPKKTWEGVVGGLIFTIICALIVAYFSGMDWKFWLFSAFIVAPASIFGDLFESSIKRSLNIKDSGSLLPGHGGILDRFDATLIASPLFFTVQLIYFYFCS
jgi:phosphatidate cytidylyltransferase